MRISIIAISCGYSKHRRKSHREHPVPSLAHGYCSFNVSHKEIRAKGGWTIFVFSVMELWWSDTPTFVKERELIIKYSTLSPPALWTHTVKSSNCGSPFTRYHVTTPALIKPSQNLQTSWELVQVRSVQCLCVFLYSDLNTLGRGTHPLVLYNLLLSPFVILGYFSYLKLPAQLLKSREFAPSSAASTHIRPSDYQVKEWVWVGSSHL